MLKSINQTPMAFILLILAITSITIIYQYFSKKKVQQTNSQELKSNALECDNVSVENESSGKLTNTSKTSASVSGHTALHSIYSVINPSKTEEELRRAEESKQKQEWAQKMAEIRRQKKLEREKEEAERQEKERKEKEHYVKILNKIGASIDTSRYRQVITANEGITLSDLFSALKKIRHSWECHITSLDGNELMELYDHSVYLYEEGIKKDFERDKDLENYLFCYLENRQIKRITKSLDNIIIDGVKNIESLKSEHQDSLTKIEHALSNSDYCNILKKVIDCSAENDMLVINYDLPCIADIPTIKEYKFILSKKEISIKKQSDAYISKLYEQILYSITLRSIFEAFSVDESNQYNAITFNGFVNAVNPSTGQTERKCILSIQTSRDRFNSINLEFVEPKACFKNLKGVSAAKLIDESPIVPILTFNKGDKRFIAGRNVEVNRGTNLASMHWEDFEQLVRELFELEFANNGSEVHVTQASRDGGVDAIIFDPDPLRGGKIVIQAKRYTNTVGVSAVRDLYGTVINEGANTGILITTSDYGHDSYEFAKDKPLKLLNGGHLLSLLHKNGRKAHINIEEAREQLKSEKHY